MWMIGNWCNFFCILVVFQTTETLGNIKFMPWSSTWKQSGFPPGRNISCQPLSRKLSQALSNSWCRNAFINKNAFYFIDLPPQVPEPGLWMQKMFLHLTLEEGRGRNVGFVPSKVSSYNLRNQILLRMWQYILKWFHFGETTTWK